MKNLSLRLALMTMFSSLALFSAPTAVLAAEEDRRPPADWPDAPERQANEPGQRPGPMMRRPGAFEQRRGARRQPGPEGELRPMRQFPGAPAPMATKVRQDIHGFLSLVMLVWITFNILLAVWIFTDIRKRGEGSGIFIALALLAGIPAAIIYALVRLGDKKP